MKRVVLFALVGLCTLRLCAITQEEATQNLRDAVNNNDVAAVKKAIENGADVNARESAMYAVTLFENLVQLQKTELVKAFLESGKLTEETINTTHIVNPRKDLFVRAIDAQDPSIVELLLKSGKVDKDVLNAKEVILNFLGRPALLKLLLDDPEVSIDTVNKDYNYGSLLFDAIEGGYKDAVELLLKSSKTKDGTISRSTKEILDDRTILEYAIDKVANDIFKVILASDRVKKELVDRKQVMDKAVSAAKNGDQEPLKVLVSSDKVSAATLLSVAGALSSKDEAELFKFIFELPKFDKKTFLNTPDIPTKMPLFRFCMADSPAFKLLLNDKELEASTLNALYGGLPIWSYASSDGLKALLASPKLSKKTLNAQTLFDQTILMSAMNSGFKQVGADVIAAILKHPDLESSTINKGLDRAIQFLLVDKNFSKDNKTAIMKELLKADKVSTETLSKATVISEIMKHGDDGLIKLMVESPKVKKEAVLELMGDALNAANPEEYLGKDGFEKLLTYEPIKESLDAPAGRWSSILHAAAELGRKEAVEKLIKAGANPQLKDKQGKGPIDLVPKEDSGLKELLQKAVQEAKEKLPKKVDAQKALENLAGALNSIMSSRFFQATV